jgi:hypothetical protein
VSVDDCEMRGRRLYEERMEPTVAERGTRRPRLVSFSDQSDDECVMRACRKPGSCLVAVVVVVTEMFITDVDD